MAKICMISVNHSPLDDRIFFKEARTLQRAGHELSMICRADENGILFDMGNVIKLNKSGQTEMEFEGIRTYAIKSPFSKIDKTLKKFFKGPFYYDFIAKATEIDADVYHAHEPESYYIGLQIAKQNGAKVIFDSHESYTTGTAKEMWIKSRHLDEMRYLITANHITRGHLVSLNHHIKSAVIYNAAQPSLFTDSVRDNKPKEITIAHDGYLPFNRGLKEMLEAFKIVNKKHPLTKFKIIGNTTGKEKVFFDQFISQNSLQKVVEQTGWVPYQKVPELLADCQIGIIAKTPTVNNIIGGPPIKYYNYTGAGMAVIDVDMPETTRLLSKFKNGISISSKSISELANGMLKLIETPELLEKYQVNSKLAFQDLNWDKEGLKLVEFYKNVVLNTTQITMH
jgi:glycosyltransferase involved in cell wall biosynthesis